MSGRGARALAVFNTEFQQAIRRPTPREDSVLDPIKLFNVYGYNAVFIAGAAQPHVSKKLAEEAIEVVIDAMNGDRDAVVRESADLIYNLVVLWVAAGVHPKDVWAEMEPPRAAARASPRSCRRSSAPTPSARRKVVALESRRVRKRR